MVLGPSLGGLRTGSQVLDAASTMQLFGESMGPAPVSESENMYMNREFINAVKNLEGLVGDHSTHNQIDVHGNVTDDTMEDLNASMSFRDSL